jgi:serine/threonine protein kinase
VAAEPKSPGAGTPTHIGRFELRRVLGRGAQGVVWQAFDPQLEREVAIKQMRAGRAEAQAVQRWMTEARAVSRLSHPHIVTLFEADLQGDQPCLVFEYVSGQTLAELIGQRGAMAAAVAVPLMLGVLDGLAHAHAAGVIHRDLKPSNVIVDTQSRARVMDFGLALINRSSSAPVDLVGTTSYMAPEVIRGTAPTAAMDVFSAGLVLYELLTGRPAVAESDPYRALYRLANEDLGLSSDLAEGVDDGLRAIVRRALARDVADRYADAASMRAALSAWLAPADSGAGPDSAGSKDGADGNGTLDFLLRRMRHKADFPALSDSISRIHRITQSENESVASLSNEILKDVALTNKLLRLVNSTYYSTAGGGTISTVSRAVALVGFAGIRNLALSLVLLDHMRDKQNIGALREEFLRALMAGTLANELGQSPREAEEAFIGAVLQNLGRMLTQFYFPEEAEQIRRRLAQKGSADAGGAGKAAGAGAPPTWAEEMAAARHVLGVGYDELAQGVARHWALPDALLQTMRRLPTDTNLRTPETAQERLQTLASAANEVTDALLGGPEAGLPERLDHTYKRYGKALGLQSKALQQTVAHAQERMRELASSLSITVRPGSPMASMLGQPAAAAAGTSAGGSGAGAGAGDSDSLAGHKLEAAAARASSEMRTPVGPQDRAALADSVQAAESLAAGVQDITNTMVEDSVPLQQVLRMVLETIYRSLAFERVVLCLREPRSGALTGRFALGLQADSVAPRFQVKLAGASDVFSASCAKGADMLIADATVGNIANRLPEWFVRSANAPTFLLLPLMVKGAPIGLIYADKSRAGDIVISERELSLLRTLRNQAVMALRQASKG